MRSLAAKVVATVCALGAVVVLGFSAAPAGAVVADLGGHGYGITLRHGVNAADLGQSALGARSTPSVPSGARRFDEPPLGGTELANREEGPVMHSATTHIVYWDPAAQFTSTTKGIINGFFADVAGDSGLPTNVFAIAGQYTDRTGDAAYNSTFAGALVDERAYPTAGDCAVPGEGDSGPYERCLFDRQLQEELVSFIAERGLPRGPTQLYFVLLPHKVATCMEGLFKGKKVCSNNFFCAYHSFISPGTSNEIIYADIPFSLLDSGFAKGCQADGNAELQLPNGDKGSSDAETRFADVALKYVSHEYIEAVTDPLVEFHTAWVDEEGLEIGDKCNAVPLIGEEEPEPGLDLHAFTPTLGGSAALGTLFNQSIHGRSYYLQSEWDNAAKACRMKPLSLGEGSFGVPSATAGAPVTFTGNAFDPYPGFEPTWTFGDGATGSGATVSHTYGSAGQFTVTMTPRDRLTDATGAPVSHTVVVSAAPVVAATVAAPPQATPPATVATVTPHSTFAAATAVVNAKTGLVTLTTSVLDPGTFGFRATFPNGRFGAFASSVCRKPRIRLARRCLPATIVYASGSKALAVAGTVRVTLKPSASALKALRRALRQRRGLPLTLVLTFQSARGGNTFSRSQALIVRPRR